MHEALGSLGRKSMVLNDEKLAGASWRLEDADARERIEWAVETYGEGLALSASFGGGEGMALLDIGYPVKLGAGTGMVLGLMRTARTAR